MKLRDALNHYMKWTLAVAYAMRNRIIDPIEYDIKLQQLQIHARAWIGEDLLNREL